MNRPARRRQRGFTMLELLITLLVTVFGLMGAMALHSSLTAGNTYASRTQEASAVGAQVMESLRAKRTKELSTALTGSPLSVPPMTRLNYASIAGRNALTYTVDVSVAQFSSTLWKLRVVVKWTDESTGDPRMFPIELITPSSEAL